MKEKRKKIKLSSYLITLTTIFTINFLGINYAHWNEHLNINTSLSTAIMAPSFNTSYELDNNGYGDLKVDFYEENNNLIDSFGSKINNVMEIRGRVDSGYEGQLTYYVENKGTIPIKIKNQQIDPGEKIPLYLKIKENTLNETEILCKQWNSKE